MHRAIDGGQVAILFGKRGENLLIGQRMRLSAQNLQNGLPRARQLARLAAKPRSEFGQSRMTNAMRMHFHPTMFQCSIMLRIPKRVPRAIAASLARLKRFMSLR